MRSRRPLYTGADGEGVREERSRWREQFGFRRAASIAALGILAVLGGILTAAHPLAAVAVAGAGLAILVGSLTLQAVNARRRPSDRPEVRSIVPFLLLCYIFPMFMLSRIFSLVGKNPIYLPDVLVIVIAGIAMFRARWRNLGLYALISSLIGLFMLHAVYVGHEHGYSGATKGLVMAFYPVVAVPIAGWVAQRTDIERLLSVLPRFVFPFIVFGMIVAHRHHMVPEAYGLEYACAGSFLVVPGIPGRKLLGLGFVAGAALLIAYSAKRGVELTLCISIAAAWLATMRLRKLSRRTIVALACGLLAAVLAASIVEGIIVVPPNVPLLSHIAKRASGQQSAAAKNVTLRELLWGYALKTSWDEDPLFGVGAYHPIDVDYQGNDIATKGFFGVHDSYIGYTFYAGFLEGALVVFVFLWGVVRLWRVRRRSIYAPAVLGCLVAAILTATTNVSFELTYLGGPSWLILGLAFGLSAQLLDRPDPEPAVVSSPGHEVTAAETENRAYANLQGHGRHLSRRTPSTASVTT